MKDLTILDQIITGRVDPYIYAFRTNTVPNCLKIGDTYRPVSVRLKEWKKKYPDLKKEYEHKAKIDENIFFRDFAVHQYLERDLQKHRLLPDDIDEETYYSNEFFKNSKPEDIEKAIEDIKSNYERNTNKYQYYDAETHLPKTYKYASTGMWKLRPNQKEAVENFKKAVKKGRTNLLMYAVMRFGKSFTSLCCALEMNAKIVMVVSAKADVKDEWKKTVESADNFKAYDYITSDNLIRNENIIKESLLKNRRLVIFLTLQDLQGPEIKSKHKELFKNNIDLLIVDETHFGARAEKYGEILKDTTYEKDIEDTNTDEFIEVSEADKQVKQLKAKIKLHLSGTPYRILMSSEFEKDDIIAFCQFTDIVEEKEKWDQKNILEDEIKEWDNPYYGFPQMIRFAFNPNESTRRRLEQLKNTGATYAFSALFKTQSTEKAQDDSHKKFIYEKEILDLFEVIDGTKEDEQLLGFLDYSKIKEGKMCRHIVCVLPYRASCDALEELINNNKESFKNLNEYEIINISGIDNKYKTIEQIKEKIYKCEKENKKTLTLTVNRMLTGSTVEQWDTMLYFKDIASPQEYDQSIFRLQNQYVKEYVSEDGDVIKYNMKPQTLLVDFDPNRMFSMQEKKALIYNVNTDENGNNKLKKRLENELKISPIIVLNKNKMVEIKPEDIMKAVSNYSKNKGVIDETNEIPVDLKLLDYEEIKNVINKQAELGSSQGLKLKNTEDEEEELDLPDDETEENNNNHQNEDIEKNDQIDNEEERLAKQFRTYYARILFFAYLTESNVISLEDIIESMNNNDNIRIAKNLELNVNVLKLINDNINKFTLSQLDYKIQNINNLAKDKNIDPLKRAKTAISKFGKLSDSEVLTPSKVCDNMISLISDKELKQIVDNNGKILDIASKAGEFSIAIFKRLKELYDKNDEKITKNIYAIPTSSIAYEFTRKIYKILNLNVDNIAENFNTYDLLDVKNEKTNKIDYAKIRKIIGQNKRFRDINLKEECEGDEYMKFNIVVGNPPYQENVGNEKTNGSLSKQLFPAFMVSAFNLDADYVSLVTPSRWFAGDGQDKSFVKLRNFIKENNHIESIYNYPNEKEVFPNVEIKGGVNYFLYKKDYKGLVKFVNCEKNVKDTKKRKLFEKNIDIIISDSNIYPILEKVINKKFVSITKITTGRNAFNFIGKEENVIKNSKEKYFKNSAELRCKNNVIRYIDPNIITKNRNIFEHYKVFISKSAGNPNSDLKIIGMPYVGKPFSACTDSLFPIGCFDSEIEAVNLAKYMKTKFLRFMISISKVSQNVTQLVYKFVPLQDFTNESDIDWNKSIGDIDRQLYKKYKLSDSEIAYIEKKIDSLITRRS